jgi:hypothetical protein
MFAITFPRQLIISGLAVVAVVSGATASTAQPAAAPQPGADQAPEAVTKFEMVRSSGAVNAGCLRGAGAAVTVKELGAVEVMTVKVHDLPAATAFDLFVTQDSEAPFGVSWYQADLRTDQSGNGKVVVRGRFNVETFAVAPGVTDAPVVHETDADTNPPFDPIHTFHLGVWFDSPEEADAAGCPDTLTPFNGDHDAGIQALSTRNFPQLEGPLSKIG